MFKAWLVIAIIGLTGWFIRKYSIPDTEEREIEEEEDSE